MSLYLWIRYLLSPQKITKYSFYVHLYMNSDKKQYIKYKFKYMVLKNRIISMVIGSLHSLSNLYEEAVDERSTDKLEHFTTWLGSEIQKIKILNDYNNKKIHLVVESLEQVLDIGKKGFNITDQSQNLKEVRSLLLYAQENIKDVLSPTFPGALTGLTIHELTRYVQMSKKGVTNVAALSELVSLTGKLAKYGESDPGIKSAIEYLSSIDIQADSQSVLSTLEKTVNDLKSVNLSTLKDFLI